jgi:hypothetical protein
MMDFVFFVRKKSTKINSKSKNFLAKKGQYGCKYAEFDADLRSERILEKSAPEKVGPNKTFFGDLKYLQKNSFSGFSYSWCIFS